MEEKKKRDVSLIKKIKSSGREFNHVFNKIKRVLQGVSVYALVGKSGTGKSFRAKLLAEKLGIEYIIDDGLLIHKTEIVAGRSAKKEVAYVGAIKTALFDDPIHRLQVVQAIEANKVKKILLLGTSDKMVKKMADRLELPDINKIVQIEDIASKEDIEKAIKSRFEEGKHIIPVPVIEVKRDYAHILSDSIRVFFKGNKNGKKGKNSRIFEKSVVQPSFHKEKEKEVVGNVTISEAALTQMILHCMDEFNSELEITKIRVTETRTGYGIRLFLTVPFGKTLSGELHELRAYIQDKIQRYTGIILEYIEISIHRVDKPKEKKRKKK